MAFTFDATSGGTTANSYLTVAEADDYFAGFTGSADWEALSLEEKQKHLVTATRSLDTELWAGIKKVNSQALEWPRTGIIDHNGYNVTGVPSQLKNATCELVIWNMTDRVVSDFELESLESYKVGPLDIKTRAGAYKKYPDTVTSQLNKIGPGAWAGGRKAFVDMVR